MARQKGRGKTNAKEAKAKAKAKGKARAARQAAPTRPKQPKREKFSEANEAHKIEVKRLVKIACAAPHNLTTQPAIRAFITDDEEKLDQNPLFYGVGDKSQTLTGYILKVMRETGNEAGIAPKGGVTSWHAGINFGTCEYPDIVDVVVHDDGEDASDAVEPERVLCFRSLRGRVLTYESGWRRDSISVAPEATREPLARRRFHERHGSADEEMNEPAVRAPDGAVFDREVFCRDNVWRSPSCCVWEAWTQLSDGDDAATLLRRSRRSAPKLPPRRRPHLPRVPPDRADARRTRKARDRDLAGGLRRGGVPVDGSRVARGGVPPR